MDAARRPAAYRAAPGIIIVLYSIFRDSVVDISSGIIIIGIPCIRLMISLNQPAYNF